jgi:LuxR family transcriptional regulator, maltose regulon positive regulatory protein
MAGAAGSVLGAGQAALESGDWEAARTHYEAAVAEDPSAEALEGLGSAYFWLDHPDTIEVRERAFRAYRARVDARGAARQAIALAFDVLTFRGEDAVAQGWLELAEQLLDGEPTCTEHGLLAAWQADFRITVTGETEAGVAHARRAIDLGRELGDADIELIGRSQLGLALVARGDVAEGLRMLQASAAAAVVGEIADRALAGFACCYLIAACDQIHDVGRAAQWCRRLDALCDRVGYHVLQEFCRAKYAGVLLEAGDWDRAEQEMLRAAQHLSARRPALAAEAIVRLAELRRRQGRYDEAEALFTEAEGHPQATLGMGALALDRNDPRSAVAAAERFLRGHREHDVVFRAAGVELVVRARLALGEIEAAEAALTELEAVAMRVGPGPLQATARMVAAEVHLAKGQLQLARQTAEDAFDLYRRAGVEAGAELARALLAGIARETEGPDRSLLTAREIDVLRLVAEGLTNAAIAARLVLSEHTVHRHLANVTTKLGVGNRAAAVARATEIGLL